MVTYESGDQQLLYIPLEILRGEKQVEKGTATRVLMEDWPWPYPYYVLNLKGKVKSVDIDPSLRMADVDLSNNSFPIRSSHQFFGKKN